MTFYLENRDFTDTTSTNGKIFDDTAGDVLVVKQGVVIATDATPYFFSGGHLTATIAGTVVDNPETSALQLKQCIRAGRGLDSSTGGSTINVTETGTLSGGMGVFMYQGGNTLNNAGMISGTSSQSIYGFGAYMAGANNTINNTGTILGTFNGIRGGASGLRVVNDGSIIGVDIASGYAIRFIGASSSVLNNGTISGAVQGVRLEEGSCTITNSGDISGTVGNGIFASGTLENIANTGTVSGGANGMHLNAGNCSVQNAGMISGLSGSGIVSLGNLQSVFNTGTISGADHGIANVALSGIAGVLVENEGSITSSGMYSSAIYAASRLRLNNSGTISSQGYYAVQAGGSTISNSGSIVSLYGVAAIGLNSTNSSTITNHDTGMIAGPGGSNAVAIRNVGAGALTLVNDGEIMGGVILGSNSDSYNGTFGKVTGTVDGGAGNDTILGGEGRELIKGGGGSDEVSAGGGNDVFIASQNDGDDLYDGGSGIDRISFVGIKSGGVAVDLAAETANGLSSVNIGTDVLMNVEQIVGSASVDSLAGDSLANVISGGGSADTIFGADGNDRLMGDAGADILIGGIGRDRLTGGSDSDTFRYLSVLDSVSASGNDQLFDFVSSSDAAADHSLATDVIDLAAIDADGNSGNGNQGFAFIGYASSSSSPPAFNGVAGQLRAFSHPGTTIVEADINGDSIADFRIVIVGVHTIAAGDFAL